MPPRYAYWTIIVDNQPTAFRAGALDDIMPTFNRLKEKQPTAKLMWFQSGKLWPSRIDAREAMQVRGERGRYSDPRQDGGDKTPSRERPRWKSKDFSSPEQRVKPEWKPKRTDDRRPFAGRRSEGQERPEWKPRGSASPPSFAKASTSAKATADKSEGKQAPGPQRGSRAGVEAHKPSSPEDPAKRKWIPKAEYKKLTGTEAKRDDKWRPGGEHKDPRQKYQDAKKAKWGRFKQAIRSRAAKSKKS